MKGFPDITNIHEQLEITEFHVHHDCFKKIPSGSEKEYTSSSFWQTLPSEVHSETKKSLNGKEKHKAHQQHHKQNCKLTHRFVPIRQHVNGNIQLLHKTAPLKN